MYQTDSAILEWEFSLSWMRRSFSFLLVSTNSCILIPSLPLIVFHLFSFILLDFTTKRLSVASALQLSPPLLRSPSNHSTFQESPQKPSPTGSVGSALWQLRQPTGKRPRKPLRQKLKLRPKRLPHPAPPKEGQPKVAAKGRSAAPLPLSRTTRKPRERPVMPLRTTRVGAKARPPKR